MANMSNQDQLHEPPSKLDDSWLPSRRAIYVPEDFRKSQQTLPIIPKRKGTQMVRTIELLKEKSDREAAIREEAKLLSAQQSQELEALLTEATQKLSVYEADLTRLQRERHALLESKRQRTLSAWFQRPEGERPALQLPTRSSHFHVSADRAKGYSASELQRTFRSHVERVEHFIEGMVSDPLKQLQLADAVNRRFQGIRSCLAHDNVASTYILESLRNFEATLRARYNGRYPNQIRAAHQAVSAAIMCKVPQRKVAIIADAIGFAYDALVDGRHRWCAWFDGTEAQLTDLRGAIRKDKMDEEWIHFAATLWEQETRPAPSTKFSIRNPHNRSDKKLYRIHYLDMRIMDMHALILERGREKFADSDPPFHFSFWYCVKVRPFFVKAAGRETSVCIYHLRFDLLVEALYVFYKRLRDAKVCNCTFDNIKHAADFRRTLVCRRDDNSRYDNNECVTTDCVLCGELQQLNICGCIDLDSTQWLIRWEEYKPIQYTRKDGSNAEKKDFVVVNTTFQEFLLHFKDFWKRFAIHHQTAKLQDDDIRWIKLNPERGRVSSIEDFSENDHIQPKREHATRYFTEVGYTLYGMVMTGHLDDFKNISEEHLTELRDLFQSKGLPAAITETHIVISGDLTHDVAAVMHFNDHILTPYIKAQMTNIVHRTRITDGAPQHFKLADLALWTSKQQCETGISSEHLFGATAHRKDLSDSECGGAKHCVHRKQMTSMAGETSKVKEPYDAYEVIRDDYGNLTHERFIKRGGVGVYRRFIYWVPTSGSGSIDRNFQKCKTLSTKELGGIKSLHQLVDVGVPGQLRVRQCSCHSCPNCQASHFDRCVNIELLGPVELIQLQLEHGRSVRLTRDALSDLGKSLAREVQRGEIIGIELAGGNESFMLGKVVSSKSYVVETGFESYMGRFEPGDEVLDVQKLEPTSLGSSMYEFTEKQFPVFVEDIRKRNMQHHLERLDLSRRSARIASSASSSNEPSQREVYVLSVEGKQDMLKLTAADVLVGDRRNLRALAS